MSNNCVKSVEGAGLYKPAGGGTAEKVLFDEKYIRIFNASGQLIEAKTAKVSTAEYKIDASQWMDGLYFIYIQGENAGFPDLFKVIKN